MTFHKSYKPGILRLIGIGFIVLAAFCLKSSYISGPIADISTMQAASINTAAGSAGKYNPQITISTVKVLDKSLVYPSGDSLENNVWTGLMYRDLGIELSYLWKAKSSQASEKYNIMIASNDLPDIFSVDLKQFDLLSKTGAIEDLTQVYDQCASPFTKSFLTLDGGKQFSTGLIENKLMGLPATASLLLQSMQF